MSAGYQALREGTAWLDLAGRGHIRVTGEDRARLLHAMTTNHVLQLQPGQGCYAFFLDAQGHILADVNLLCSADHFALDTEPETARLICAHLQRHIIADDVALEDLTAQTAALGLEGPTAAQTLAALEAPIPEAPGAHLSWGERRVARLTATGADGFRLFTPLAGKAALVAELEASGAVPAGPQDALVVRLELGRPRYGEDITARRLPQETQRLEAVHFNKGCYLGQEIVERIRSRGLVHRLLVRLRIDARQPPAPAAKILAGDTEIGEITSAAFSPALGHVVALGYVRREALQAAVPLTAAGAPAGLISDKLRVE